MLSKFLNSKNGKRMNRALTFMLVFTLTFANYMLIGMYFAESSISYAKEEKEVSFEVEQEFKTNKVYEFEEGFKRVVQLEITSKIENAQGKAEFVIPETLIENKAAEEIKVNSYETDFTFENGKVCFAAKGKNSFNITYIYDEEYTYNEEEKTYEFNEEPELESKEISVSVEIEEKQKISAKAEKVEYTEKLQFGDIVTLNETIKDIYKGNMYLKQDTEYSKKIAVDVRAIEKDLVKDNFIISSSERVLHEETNEETGEIIAEEIEDSVYYKSTSFSKTELLKLFGQEANIIITAKANETEKNTIILFSEYDEKEYEEYEIIDLKKLDEKDDEIIIEHEEEVKDVEIKTTIPENEGIFNITYNKIIKLDEFVDEEKINKLDSSISLECEETNFAVNSQNSFELKEPETTATIGMEYVNSNQTVLSSIIENKVNFAINLITDGPENKIYKNPIIKISLPSAVTVASINDVALALEDGLKIKNSSIINNTIIIELEGEQENYNYDEMQQSISIGAVLKVDRTTPSGEIEITSTCKNGEDEVELEKIKANVFSPAELISVTNISVKEQDSTSIEKNNTIKINTFDEETVANIDISLINNHGDTIKGLQLKGNLCGKDSTFNSNLLEEIKLSGMECKVEYFNGEEKVQDIASAKTYVVSIDEMKQGEQLNLSYALSIPKNLPYNENINTSLNIDYKYAGNDNEKELNMQITTGKGPSAKIEINPEATNEVLNGGQVATYNIKVINDGDENIPEAIFTYETVKNAKIIQYTTLQGAIFEYLEDEDNKKEWNIKDLAVGEEVEAQVIVKLDNVKEKDEFSSKASLVAGEKTIAIEETEKKVVPAEFEIMMTTYSNTKITLDEQEEYKYRIEVKNVSGKDITNAIIKTSIPQNTSFVEGYIYDIENSEEQKQCVVEKNEVTYKIDKFEKDKTLIAVLEVKVEDLPEEMNNEVELTNYATVEADKVNKTQSNTITNTVHTADFEIHLTTNNPVSIEEHDNIEYNITVTNTGKRSKLVKIEDSVPDIISVNKITYYASADEKTTKYVSNSEVDLFQPIEEGQTINVKVEGIVKDLKDDEETRTINNIAKLNLGNGSYIESEVVTNIINSEPEEQLKADNNENSSSQKEDVSDKKEKTYSILGVAWLDANEDGKRESSEKALEGLEVLLVNANTGEVIEKNKEKLVTKTSKDGAYNFEGLKNGEYKVLFKYDTSKYQTTVYQKEEVSDSVNSDASMQTVTINKETQTVALTDTIKINDSSVVNIDLGLKENNTFDLSLKKQIKKVTVKNSSGTTEYDFTNTDFAKIEIPGKNYKGSTLLIEYEIIVANEGDVTAYITDIMDYMPKELTFNSEMNTNWYIDSEGVLHDIALSMEEIAPGKQVSEKLVLTKTIASDESLTIENIAEIGSATNAEGLEEKDSTAANKKDSEDDLGKAQLIVSVKTGGTWMYIGITLISLIIITVGIYLINKKVLKGII